MGGTSFNPLASNHGAFSQSNPSPKVLSAFATYQWQDASGISTAQTAQSSVHCGTCTQMTGSASNAGGTVGNATDNQMTDTHALKIEGRYLTLIGLLYTSMTSW